MKITILTTVWEGEFDEAEFPHYDRHVKVGESGQVNVYEVIELDSRSRVRIDP